MSGRRPGPSTTRQQLIDAAAEVLADRGVGGATTRGIAERAGVDPAMIAYYFGSKGGLVKAVTALPVVPANLVGPVLDADADDAARVLLTVILTTWDAHAPALVAVLRSATHSTAYAAQLRTFILDSAARPVAARFSPSADEVETRAALMGAQIAGIIFARYVFCWEPLASAAPEWVVRTAAPAVQACLRGPLPGPQVDNA